MNTKFNTKIENKIPNNSEYIPTKDVNKLTAENVAARLKQAEQVEKARFDNKITITSNKTKHLEVQKQN